MAKEFVGSGNWATYCKECHTLCFGETTADAKRLAKMHCRILKQDREVLERIAVEALKIGINHGKVDGLIPAILIEQAHKAAHMIGDSIISELTFLRTKSPKD